MKRHTLLYITRAYSLPLLIALLCSSCATRRTGTNAPQISLTPSPCEVLMDTGRTAEVNLSIHIPANYVSRRSRLVITPQVLRDDSTLLFDLHPVVLDAGIYSRKKHRREVLDNFLDPYGDICQRIDKRKATTIPYTETITLPADVRHACIVADVSHDGCGACTGWDRLYMADLFLPEPVVVEPALSAVTEVVDTVPAPPAHEPLGLTWIEPKFVVREKLMKGQGTAHMQFIINKYDIVPSLGNNRAELEGMVAKLEPILADTLAEITEITIYGMASADGPLSLNIPLSANRAKAAKEWLASRLNLPASIVSHIKTGSRPEGWQPVLDAMTADGHPDSVKVKEILRRYADQNDDVAEKYIRRLSCWPDIRERYLQKDRKVDYTYAWTMRSFTTDAELIQMYQSRPDAFNEEELLRVAQLAADDASRELVYRYTLSRFPSSRVARNNLAILLEQRGAYEEAKELIEAPSTK